MENPVGVTDTSCYSITPPFGIVLSDHIPSPRRSGVAPLPVIRRPFRASFDWGVSIVQGFRPVGLHHLPVFRCPVRASFDLVFPLCRGFALTGFTACLYSVAPSGLHLIGAFPLCRGCAPACGLSPFQGLLGVNIPNGACLG